MPKLDVAAALGVDFGAGLDEDSFDSQRDRRALGPFFGCVRQVFGVVEVEFIDGRETVEPIRSQHQVEGLTKRAFADIVRAHHEGVPVKQQFG